MKYQHTECKSCKTKEKKLFALPKMRDVKDYFCKDCLNDGKQIEVRKWMSKIYKKFLKD